MRFQPEHTVAVLIDVQERLFPHIHAHEVLEANTHRLLRGLQVLEIPILKTQQYTAGLGETIPALNELLPQAHLEKMCFSCQGDAAFRTQLEKHRAEQVILFGIETHICVLQTAIDLVEAGYQVGVVANCCSSRKPEDKTLGLSRMQQEGVLLASYESILMELCVVSGTERFKQISRIIK